MVVGFSLPQAEMSPDMMDDIKTKGENQMQENDLINFGGIRRQKPLVGCTAGFRDDMGIPLLCSQAHYKSEVIFATTNHRPTLAPRSDDVVIFGVESNVTDMLTAEEWGWGN